MNREKMFCCQQSVTRTTTAVQAVGSMISNCHYVARNYYRVALRYIFTFQFDRFDTVKRRVTQHTCSRTQTNGKIDATYDDTHDSCIGQTVEAKCHAMGLAPI